MIDMSYVQFGILVPMFLVALVAILALVATDIYYKWAEHVDGVPWGDLEDYEIKRIADGEAAFYSDFEEFEEE